MGLTATLAQTLRTEYPSNLDKNEDRLSQYGAWEAFVSDTNSPDSIITQDVIDKAKRSAGNSVAVPVIDGEDVTISNVRSCTISEYENTSALVTLTFVTYAFGFTMVPAQYYNNNVNYEADWANKMKKYLKKFAATLDSAAVAKLEADKSQIMASPLIGSGAAYGDLSGNAIQVAPGMQQFFFNDLDAIMAADDFYGPYNIIGSQSLKSVVRKYLNQGNNNGVNSAYQFGDYNFGYSNRVTVGSGKAASLYAMPKGTLATINRNDPDSIAGSMINSENYFEEVSLPIVNLTMGSRYFKECADHSGYNGGSQNQLKASVRETFMFSTDVCFITAYNRDNTTLAGPIHKAELTVGP